MLRIFLFVLALAPLASPLQAGVWDSVTSYFKGQTNCEPPMIRVLILHNAEGANLQVRGKYSLFDPFKKEHESTRFAGKCRYIQAAAEGLKWGESFPGLYQLQIRPKQSTTLATVDGQDYEGTLNIYDIGGTISIVNWIPVESYVSAVMASFQGQDLEPETLAAIAIVIRTNAYFQSVNPKNTYWDVDAQKVGFKGINYGCASTEEAARQTRYMIMSRTGIYERVATPFPSQFGNIPTGVSHKEAEVSKITIEEANALAQKGEHAAMILGKAFPGTNIMLMQYR